MADLSRGVYRIPYADGTRVKITNDHLTHEPLTRIDMEGVSDDKPYRLVAAATGTIRFIVDGFSENRPDQSPCNNNYVWIEHPNGEWTKYSHMTKASVTGDAGLSVGDQVNRGTFLGFEDDVGCAHGTHLHFEVGVPEDPSDPINEEGGLRGGSDENRIPRICGIPGGIFEKGQIHTVAPCVLEAAGRLAFLRVHDVGGKFGPPGNQLDVEVVARLDSEPTLAFGFQLRAGDMEGTAAATLDVLRTALRRNRRIRVDYRQTAPLGGEIVRVTDLP